MRRLLFICFSVLALNVNAKPFELLEKLTNAYAPSGFEDSVAELIKKAWQPQLKSLHEDGVGNLIGVKKGQRDTRILLMAHMDEVGFMVSDIDDSGLVKVQALGGIMPHVIPAQKLVIVTEQGPVTAYTGIDSPHSIAREARASARLIASNQLFLDIGAKDKQDAIKNFHVSPGQAVSFDSRFTHLGGSRYLAKALDDRLGLALLTDVLKDNPKPQNTLLFAATVQEEVGLRGAKVVYEQTKPDVVFNLEVGIASDFPLRLGRKSAPVALGKGPTIFVFDASMIPNHKLVAWAVKVANKHHIPVQLETEAGYGEDGAAVQTSGHGVSSINITVPVRYAHQQASIFDANDYKQAVKLLNALVSEYKKGSV